MDHLDHNLPTALPQEMLSFTLTHIDSSSAARLGRLLLRGRKPVHTPHYVAITSRGVVPHLSHDTMQRHTGIVGAYMALEDCRLHSSRSRSCADQKLTECLVVEKTPTSAPILNTPASAIESRLRKFVALGDECLSILGPRRVSAIPCPAQHTASAISISTSVGFRQLKVDDYVKAVHLLRPDISVEIADIITAEKASVKRVQRSAERTHAWLRDTLVAKARIIDATTAFFASIPSLENTLPSLYLSDLVDDFKSQISGLTVYSSSTINAIPQELSGLPRLCLSQPASPHGVLAAILQGADILTIPFVTMSSEHGIALSFSFPGKYGQQGMPLANDLWSTEHAADLSPLSGGCECYTCQRHHRAYVNHLLQAKEMLAWTLLQVHNHAIMDQFFEQVRQSMLTGQFEEDVKLFSHAYEANLPESTGEGPRIRGYQMKSVGGGEAKKNVKAYGRLDDAAQKIVEAESGVATLTGGVEELQEHGFAEKTTG